MYIKRKVFSTNIDEYGEEKLFSSSEYVEEGDYLDEMMYSDDDHLARNIALGTAGAGAAGIAGAKLVGKKMGKNLGKFAKTSKGKAALVAVPATALAGYGIYKATED